MFKCLVRRADFILLIHFYVGFAMKRKNPSNILSDVMPSESHYSKYEFGKPKRPRWIGILSSSSLGLGFLLSSYLSDMCWQFLFSSDPNKEYLRAPFLMTSFFFYNKDKIEISTPNFWSKYIEYLLFDKKTNKI